MTNSTYFIRTSTLITNMSTLCGRHESMGGKLN